MDHGAWMGIPWGEHGRWAHGVEIQLLKHYMFQWEYVSEAQVAWASKDMLGCLLKCDMFQWVVGFEVQVSRLMFHDV